MQQIKFTKKLALRVFAVAVAAVLTVGGTMAVFNDSRTLANNKIEAGRFELVLDNECHYDGMVCREEDDTDIYAWAEETAGSSTYPEILGTACDCTWEFDEDSEDRLIFNFEDVKPGDEGENTISFHLDNPGWICADLTNIEDFDNTCTTPESDDGDTTCGDPGLGEGELQDYLRFSVWVDDGGGNPDFACDNILNGDEELVVENVLAQPGVWPVWDSSVAEAGILEGCIGVAWNLPLDTENIVQTDSLEGDITFTAYQTRNNLDFVCTGVEPDTGTLTVIKETTGGDATFNFSGTGIPAFDITTVNGTGSHTVLNLAAGTYSVNEDENALPAGWSLDNNACQNVEVVVGQDTECVIENSFEEPCIDQADVMLILDRSGSIGDTAMVDLKNAALSFVASLNPDGGVHMGQTSFATTGTLDTPLSDTQAVINAGINGISSAGFTNLFQGINLARTELAGANDRPDGTTPDYMIIITDGQPNRPLPESTADDVALAEANTAKGEGTTIYVVGVGAGVNAAYLQQVATDAGHYFGIANYTDLDQVLQNIAACEGDVD